MVNLHTLILGNRKTDRILSITEPQEALKIFQDVTSENKDPFEKEKRALRFLEMHDLIRQSPHQYRIVNDYMTARWLMNNEKFDTTFVYRLININLSELKGKNNDDISQILKKSDTAVDILLNSEGLTTIFAKNKDEIEPEMPLDVYQHFMIEDIRKQNIPGLIISYLRDFQELVMLNDDIGKEPEKYIRATKSGTLEIHTIEQYLNITPKEIEQYHKEHPKTYQPPADESEIL